LLTTQRDLARHLSTVELRASERLSVDDVVCEGVLRHRDPQRPAVRVVSRRSQALAVDLADLEAVARALTDLAERIGEQRLAHLRAKEPPVVAHGGDGTREDPKTRLHPRARVEAMVMPASAVVIALIAFLLIAFVMGNFWLGVVVALIILFATALYVRS
jgi:hypothetical protein